MTNTLYITTIEYFLVILKNLIEYKIINIFLKILILLDNYNNSKRIIKKDIRDLDIFNQNSKYLQIIFFKKNSINL